MSEFVDWKRLKLQRCAARVLRCHTSYAHHRQTVGEHTFGVLCILQAVTPDDAILYKLFFYALNHDTPEAITGDVPAPVKWRHPPIKIALDAAESKIQEEFSLPTDHGLSALQEAMFRYADVMEFVMFAIEEVQAGNMLMISQARNAFDALRGEQLLAVTPKARDLSDHIESALRKFAEVRAEDIFNGWPGFNFGART